MALVYSLAAADASPVAAMTISSNPGVSVTTTFTFGSASLAPASSAFTFTTAKGLLGPSSNPISQSGFKNGAGDLFAITTEPATKSAFVYFFLTTGNGNLTLRSDVNKRVAQLLPQPWRDDAKEFLRVETIHGRKVKLSTTDYSHAPFKTHAFWVKVDAVGSVWLLP